MPAIAQPCVTSGSRLSGAWQLYPPFGAAVTVYGWVVVMFQIWPICYMDPGPADEVLDDS